MSRSFMIALSAFTLAGCGSSETDSDGDGKISLEEAAAVSDGEFVKPDPGQYRSTVEFVDVQMPGAPEQVRDQMRAMLDQGPQTNEYCLTEEEAQKGFEVAIREAQAQDNCSFETFDIEAGEIDAVMVCQEPGRGTMRMTIEGKGGRTSSDTTMTMEMNGPDGETMTLVSRSQQERIGDCES